MAIVTRKSVHRLDCGGWVVLQEGDQIFGSEHDAETAARMPDGGITVRAETREMEPTDDGWRQFEPTGRVVIVVPRDTAAAVLRLLANELGVGGGRPEGPAG